MKTNALVFSSLLLGTLGQIYEDKRCRCVCPSPGALNNTLRPQRQLYIADVPPSKWVKGKKTSGAAVRARVPTRSTALRPQRQLYIADVPPSKCNCVEVVLPNLGEIKGRESEICPRCECKYETRNTTVIKVVVISVVWLTALLLLYAGFLACLQPLMRRKKSYKDHSSEEARRLMQDYDED